MGSHFTVVYDACVLYPAPIRDFLMWLAMSDLFRAKWTHQIHEEWIRNLRKNRPEIPEESLLRTRELMDKGVRDAIVEGYEFLIEEIQLPDPNDRHVVAAAIKSNASLIVTFNLKDFPSKELERFQIVAQHPDDFVVDLINLNIAAVCNAARQHRKTLINPPKTVTEYLDNILSQGLPQTVNELKKWRGII